MNTTNPRCRRRATRSSHRPAFTLVELLVVIGIIVLLLSILVPVIGKLQSSARATNTRAGILQLAAMIQAYQGDQNSVPGPIPNNQLRVPQTGANANNISGVTPATVAAEKITMAENVYVGLMGGLKPGATAGTFSFDRALAGQGPFVLGGTPKKLPAYGDYSEVTRTRNVAGNETGDYFDEVGNADDSEIPEFLDRFPNAMPLLILRARKSIPTGPSVGPTVNSVVSPLPTTVPPAQYDQTQVTPYTGAVAGAYIGEGKVQQGEWTLAFPQHGFNDAPVTTATTASDSTGYTYPYNIYAALRHPTLPNTPKQKDSFIIISAGIDRVYGTSDDVTNFGNY